MSNDGNTSTYLAMKCMDDLVVRLYKLPGEALLWVSKEHSDDPLNLV